jgi:endonuclease YncB( thermonuclease family)
MLVHLLGVDTPEIHRLNIGKLKRSGFLDVLDRQLEKYLAPKLTDDAVEIHRTLGFKTRDYFESILKGELTVSFGDQVFDRHGRVLVYLSDINRDYNVTLVETGHAIPYFIYPNAVSPTEEGEFTYETIEKMRNAAGEAEERNQGIWGYTETILLPTEFRYLSRREPPVKYCADLEDDVLYPPQHYFKIPIRNRLFFYPRDVFAAVQMGFRPTLGCDEWLHKFWRSLQGRKERKEMEREKEKRRRIKKVPHAARCIPG